MPFILTTHEGHFQRAEIRKGEHGKNEVWLLFDGCRIALSLAEAKTLSASLRKAFGEAEIMELRRILGEALAANQSQPQPLRSDPTRPQPTR